ncbi:ExeA family protein [Desulfatitalea alkaliphila]|uniref:AAA family ATPase n=1 Tax=Desulfatitalea alkaliphila TaxID=2929485 RepID=A0AA41UJN2_9BACT|nr:ExeA family protein [Desulfatitalea alkaliphila]MCJ8502140.1 AAA family ATPase [Desulfatitalea alkaliphila]
MTPLHPCQALGLRRHPFPVAPDDACFFVSDYIRQVVVEMVHGIAARKGFLVLTGEVGLGKTTLTRRMLRLLEAKGVCTALVFHTALRDVELLREINRDFGLPVPPRARSGASLGEELRRLYNFLMMQYSKRINCTLIIDDAQNLDHDSLELVRMLSNLEAGRQKLLQIVLVGQSELRAALQRPALRQLRSRVAIQHVMQPLNRRELGAYIAFKLDRAGNQGRIRVDDGALKAIHHCTAGNFRQVNMLLDRCLYALCRDRIEHIDKAVVRTARSDMQPKGRRPWMGLPVMVRNGALALCLVAGLLGLHLHTRPDVAANAPFNGSFHAVHIPGTQEKVATPSGTTLTVPVVEDIAAAQTPVARFLGLAGLADRAAEFETARSRGNLSLWAERTYHQTGYRLIQLSRMNDALRRRCGALSLPAGADGGAVWLVWWRPDLRVQRFFEGYQGAEIHDLQQLLSAAGHYAETPDGTVDQRLINGLTDFQRRAGLPPSGFPDAATLFLLSHLQESDLS